MRKLFLVILPCIFPLLAEAKQPNIVSQGRYQVLQLSEYRRDQFLIDTQTGRMWKSVCVKGTATDCELQVWKEEIVQGITPPDVVKANVPNDK